MWRPEKDIFAPALSSDPPREWLWNSHLLTVGVSPSEPRSAWLQLSPEGKGSKRLLKEECQKLRGSCRNKKEQDSEVRIMSGWRWSRVPGVPGGAGGEGGAGEAGGAGWCLDKSRQTLLSGLLQTRRWSHCWNLIFFCSLQYFFNHSFGQFWSRARGGGNFLSI